MATSFPRPEGSGEGGGSDKSQAIPKMLLVWLVLGVVAVAIVTGIVLTHNHGGTSAGSGQPADAAVGPQLGTEGPATGRSMPAGAASGTEATGQGGGPGAKGSGAGVGNATPGTAGSRTGGVSSGAPAGPSAGTAGTSGP